MAAPTAVHAHNRDPATFAYIASGTGAPGLARFQTCRLMHMKATQKCARMILLLCNTGQPPPLCREFQEGGLFNDLDASPHALMTDAAEFVTRHIAFRWRRKARADRGDVAGHQHRIDVGVLDQEAMEYIGAGRANRDRGVRRHYDALRCERILLSDGAHSHGPVRLEGAA